MKFINALVVKLVDTKDLKAEGFTDESVRGSPRQSKTSHKITELQFSFKLILKNKVYYFAQTRARLEHREIIIYGFNNEKTFMDYSSGFVVEQ